MTRGVFPGSAYDDGALDSHAFDVHAVRRTSGGITRGVGARLQLGSWLRHSGSRPCVGIAALFGGLLSAGLAAATEPRAFTAGPTALGSRELAAETAADASGDRDDRDTAPAEPRRMYITGMVGSTLGTAAPGALAPPAQPVGTGVSGQAAVGVEIPRRVGTWRVEFEGRRFSATGHAGGPAGETGAGESAADANWATTANGWRELPIVGDLAGYAGGGAGFGTAGGRVGPAWQAGGGLAWAVTERVTFDVGYRVHGAAPRPAASPEGEVLFAVRVFEPFRGWRR